MSVVACKLCNEGYTKDTNGNHIVYETRDMQSPTAFALLRTRLVRCENPIEIEFQIQSTEVKLDYLKEEVKELESRIKVLKSRLESKNESKN